MKDRRTLSRTLRPGYRFYFFFFVLLVASSAYVSTWLAVGQGLFVLLIFLFYLRSRSRRRRETIRFVEGLTYPQSVGEGVLHFPLPMAVARADTAEVLWGNDLFYRMIGRSERIFPASLSEMLPGFDLKFLWEGQSRAPMDVNIKRRSFAVWGSLVPDADGLPAAPSSHRVTLATLYWVDVTDAVTLRREVEMSRLLCSLIVIDNYEEITKNCDDMQKSTLLAWIDERVSGWVLPYEGILRKFERDRFLFIFEERYLAKMIDDKFSLLERTRELVSPNGMPVTLSLGIGRGASSFKESFQFATLSLDMSLSRGGDQVVIKTRSGFDFYGGRTKELEKRTKVKPRVMAQALAELMTASSNVLVMGHGGADMDAVGAAAGVAAMARRRGREAHIVITKERCPALPLVEHLQSLPEYGGVFLDPQTALSHVNRDTLLVIVDTNRPDIVESQELLRAVSHVAVIDHHRRGAQYLERVALSYHEPYASSASELLCDLLQYTLDPGDLTRVEAEALLAGIVLDTKSFTMHTGVGTFEAAAFLRAAGADMTVIKRMFQNDLPSSMERYDIIRRAVMVRDNIAVAAVDTPVSRTVAAQAADELLGISGVDASVVLFPSGNEIVLSARSLGRVNVQMIMEMLGGGGHQTIAGAQVPSAPLGVVHDRLMAAIDRYMEKTG